MKGVFIMNAKLLLKEFLFDCEVRKFSKRTIKSYRNNIDLFLNYIEKQLDITDIEIIISHNIKEYMSYLYGKNLKETYINNILKSLRSYFKYCLSEEYIKMSPTEKVQWAKEQQTIINAFTDDEVKNMLEVYKWNDYLNARNKTILAVLFDTGVRCSELCNIIISDIRDTHIVISNAKGKKERYVSISPILSKYLMKYERMKEYYFKAHNLKDDNYFLSRTGRPLTNEAVERIVKLAGQQANIRTEIRCSPHTCRHYFSQAQ